MKIRRDRSAHRVIGGGLYHIIHAGRGRLHNRLNWPSLLIFISKCYLFLPYWERRKRGRGSVEDVRVLIDELNALPILDGRSIDEMLYDEDGLPT